MAALAGILNHHLAGEKSQDLSSKPMSVANASDTASTSGSSTSDSATISANDFLTLLVTEMQNQDPTADTDPNEYINQLVQVNSLEQLIDINQNVSTALGDSTSTAPSTDNAAKNAGKSAAPEILTKQTQTSAEPVSRASSNPKAVHDSMARLAPGNLSEPAVNAAGQSVASALNGRSHKATFRSSIAL